MTKTAILIDGGFYKVRAHTLFGDKSPEARAKEVEKYCMAHIHTKEAPELYRIYYYDCPPIGKKVYHPLLKKQIDFSKSTHYGWMNAFLEELKRKRKFALRLGRLSEEQCHYILKAEAVKKLCNEKISVGDLTETDFRVDMTQKGVDMKIGLDIASLAYKKQVDQIILISGDSDFVPAAKLARREGIDFILDPMRANIKADLFEHIDGIRTKIDYIRQMDQKENGVPDILSTFNVDPS